MKHRAVLAALSGLAGALLGATALAQTPAPANSVAALPAGSVTPATPPAAAAMVDDSEGVIVATVNDEPITRHDVEERLALVLSNSPPNSRPTDEEKARLRRVVLKDLENEVLRLQAARSKSITVSPLEIEQRIDEITASLKITREQLEETLARSGAKLDTLRAQLKVERAWQDTISQEFAEKVIQSVSDSMVDEEVRRISESATKPRYRVYEIFLAVDDPKDDAKVKKDAEDIHDQIRQGAQFPTVARQFSENPSAALGGDIGWATDGDFPPEINSALRELKKGMLSMPIRARGGYYILYLADRMEPYGTKVEAVLTAGEANAKELPLVRVLLPVPPNAPKDYAQQAMAFGEQYRLNLPPCGPDLKKDVEGRGAVFMDLGNFNLADLVPEAQKVLAETRPGEAAKPFLSEVGVEIFTRCDARQEVMTTFQMPTRDEVRNQLLQQRIAAMARGFERDLRRNANVEER